MSNQLPLLKICFNVGIFDHHWIKVPKGWLNLGARSAVPSGLIARRRRMQDLLVSSGPEEIWQSWEQPEIWRLPHGHISTVLIPGLTGRILRWLAPRLPVEKTTNDCAAEQTPEPVVGAGCPVHFASH